MLTYAEVMAVMEACRVAAPGASKHVYSERFVRELEYQLELIGFEIRRKAP